MPDQRTSQPSDAASRRSIDKSSPLPFYHQLKEILREDLERRRLQPGDRLAGDHELCQLYGVSRTVVRQALADLQNEGVLERVKGRGTFVAPQRTSHRLVQSLTGLYDEVAAQGRTLRSEVRTLEIAPADAEVAARLQIPPETPVVVLERLRLVDDEPWVYTVSHIPAAMAPDLIEQDLREQSLYALLENRYGLRMARGHRTVEAHSAGPRLARDLRIAQNAPVLKLTNVSLGLDGAPIETFVAYHRADRSRFEVDLERLKDDRPTRSSVRVL